MRRNLWECEWLTIEHARASYDWLFAKTVVIGHKPHTAARCDCWLISDNIGYLIRKPENRSPKLKKSHALNHSAMEAELTTSRLLSFIMAKVFHAHGGLLLQTRLYLQSEAFDAEKFAVHFQLFDVFHRVSHADLLSRSRSHTQVITISDAEPGIVNLPAYRMLRIS